MPPFADRDALVDRCLRAFLQTPGRLGVEIHHALADRGPQPAFRHGFEHRVRIVHGLHRQHRGRAAGQELGRRQAGGSAQAVRRMRGFHGPDTTAEPLQQRQVVGIPSKQRLTQVDMGLDQTGQHVSAACVDGAIVRARNRRRDGGDAPVSNRDVSLDDVQPVVHADHDAATDEQGWLLLEVGCCVLRAGCHVLGAGCWVLGAWCWVLRH
jgi:hypothetical protein